MKSIKENLLKMFITPKKLTFNCYFTQFITNTIGVPVLYVKCYEGPLKSNIQRAPADIARNIENLCQKLVGII